MNAIELYHKDGRATGVFYCEKCCAPYKCKECGVELGRYRLVCDGCSRKQQEERERQRFEKAEKVTEWTGWVFCDGLGYNEGFFDSVSDLVEWCEDEGCEVPKYAWTCTPSYFAQLSIGWVLEQITEHGDAYEGFDPQTLEGVPELGAAIDRFNELNKGVCSYYPNYKVAVVLDQKGAHE